MKKLVKSIISFVIMFCCILGSYEIKNDKQNMTASANSLNAVSAFVSSDEENAEEGFFIQIPLKTLGKLFVYHSQEYEERVFLDLPIRPWYNWAHPEKFNCRVDCQIELEFFPKDKDKNFILVVSSSLIARTFLDMPQIIEFNFTENKEFKFENEEQYNLIKNNDVPFQLLIRDKYTHEKVCINDPNTKDYVIKCPSYKLKYATFAPNYTTSDRSKTDNPEDIDGNIHNPKEPTEPVEVNEPEKSKIEIWFEQSFNFIEYPFETLSLMQKIVRIILYIIFGVVALFILSLLIKLIKFAFGKR